MREGISGQEKQLKDYGGEVVGGLETSLVYPGEQEKEKSPGGATNKGHHPRT